MTGLNLDLFDDPAEGLPTSEMLGEGAILLRRLALTAAPSLLSEIQALAAEAPFRHVSTPGGKMMSVAMTNCGAAGWVSDRNGYRYSALDPHSGRPWPVLPDIFHELAIQAAAQAGYADFQPDVCLINRYAPGARMSLHQDRDEQDFHAPIVSVSLGLPAVFLFGGMQRRDPAARYPLYHGDVVVWGGPTRLVFHGIAPLADGHHPATGPFRFNLTFRKAMAH